MKTTLSSQAVKEIINGTFTIAEAMKTGLYKGHPCSIEALYDGYGKEQIGWGVFVDGIGSAYITNPDSGF